MVESVEQHYGNDGIVDRIVGALTQSGFVMENLDPDVLAGADEFHIGGREGTAQGAPPNALANGAALLDAASGIGGAARHLARTTAATLTGGD